LSPGIKSGPKTHQKHHSALEFKSPAQPQKLGATVPKIIVEVMPKEVLLDPQGKAVANSLHRKGHNDITAVRIGKRIELHFDREVTDADIASAKQIGENFLSNAVIEDVVSVTVEN
jgi:phosphoribosylformylglycinamidine synthase subunit PurS